MQTQSTTVHWEAANWCSSVPIILKTKTPEELEFKNSDLENNSRRLYTLRSGPLG